MAKRLIVRSGRNGCSTRRRWIKRSVCHGQRPEDFVLAEAAERLFRDALECNSEDDETDIAVFGIGAGIAGKRSGECGGKKVVSRLGAQKQFFVRGQSRGV